MMNQPRNRSKVLILSQIFTLFVVLAMPLIIRMLAYSAGKVLYTILVVAAVAIAVELRRLLQGPE